MSSLNLFRRLHHPRDYTTSRVTTPNIEFRPLNTNMVCLRLDKVLMSTLQRRSIHLTPMVDQAKMQRSATKQRYGCLYACPESMREDLRSQVKFLNSKNPLRKTGVPDEDVLSREPSEVSEASLRSAESISVNITRNETARQITPPISLAPLRKEPAKTRVLCPKPNSLSPYSKSTDDQEGVSLKNHYTKVLLTPIKPFDVIYPPTCPKNIGYPKIKQRKFDQYLGTTSEPPIISHQITTIPTRNLQNSAESKSKDDTQENVAGNPYDLKKFKQATDNRYLEMCAISDENVSCPKSTRKKLVETVTIEVIKLDNKVRKSKKIPDINKELEHVLQEALAQTQVYQQNVLGLDHLEEELEEKTDSMMTVKLTPRSSHTSVVLDSEKRAVPRVCFDGQTRARVRSQSADGKHCYNVLRTEVACDALKTQVDEIDVSDNLTNLNDYEDLPDNTSAKVVAQMVSTGYKKGSSLKKCKKASFKKDVKLSIAEEEVKIAQKQHNQRVLNMLKGMRQVKAK